MFSAASRATQSDTAELVLCTSRVIDRVRNAVHFVCYVRVYVLFHLET